MKLNGKPLILAFAPVGTIYSPNVKDIAIRIVGTGVALALFADWDLWPWYLAPCTDSSCLKKLRLAIRRDGYVAISPRFDDRLLCRKSISVFSRAEALIGNVMCLYSVLQCS